MVVLPRTNLDEAQMIAERILESVAEVSIADTSLEVGLSIGIVKRSNEKDASGVIEKADKSMYRAKQGGGKRVCLFSEEGT